ncbi:type II secretion system protein [bacterium]|nr:type II secretion system protein [bacterium]
MHRIIFHRILRENMKNTNFKKGFTLIELLVEGPGPQRSPHQGSENILLPFLPQDHKGEHSWRCRIRDTHTRFLRGLQHNLRQSGTIY